MVFTNDPLNFLQRGNHTGFVVDCHGANDFCLPDMFLQKVEIEDAVRVDGNRLHHAAGFKDVVPMFERLGYCLVFRRAVQQVGRSCFLRCLRLLLAQLGKY